MIRLLKGAGGTRGASGVAELPETITHGIYVLPAQKHLESVRQVSQVTSHRRRRRRPPPHPPRPPAAHLFEPYLPRRAPPQLANTEPKPRCLVFVNSPHRARVVCERLASSYNIEAAPLFGQQARTTVTM